MSGKLIKVNFSSIKRVTDKFVRVLTESGKVITVKQPYDENLKVNPDGSGEGHIVCPRYMVEG